MKSNENEITTHLNGSFAVPFTMIIKTIVISNQDLFDGERISLKTFLITRVSVAKDNVKSHKKVVSLLRIYALQKTAQMMKMR